MPAPAKYKSSFVNLIIERGQYYQASDLDALDAAALVSEKGGKPLVGYIGFDCTAPSLHVGSLTQIFLLRRLQQCGGKPIALMGSGTTRIGDPSDKNEARPVLTLERIAQNKVGIQSVFEKYVEFEPNQAKMVDNIEWLENIGWLEMLAEIGRHFTINKMIALDIVKRRLDQESPITFLEFNYMLLQAYDFLELSRRYDCNLQMGGSDQWGNIIQGVELCRRADNKNVFGLTQPLLMNAAGQKMGKTAAGAVWLNADMLPVFDFWQYWRNVDDADVGKLLRLLTELPLDEISRLEALGGAEINDAKKILAGEITALCHGREAAETALATANAQFGRKDVTVHVSGVSAKGSVGHVSIGLPEVEIAKSDLSNIASLFVLAGLAESNGEAKRLAKGGGLKIDDKTISDVSLSIPADLLSCYSIKLSLGKKRHLNVILK